MLSATVIAPTFEIAKIPSELPPVIANKVAGSPVVETVITSASLADDSIRSAVWLAVIATPASVTVAVIVIESELVASSSLTVRITVHIFELVPEPHPGASKFGAFVNVRAPVAALIVNRALSVDPAPVEIA